MVNLLFSSPQSNILVLVFWALAVIVVLFFVIAIFVQKKKGKYLVQELQELDKIKKNNTEFEFVLKAMKIAIWRYDAEQQTFAYENDFREGMNNYIIKEGEDFKETLASISPSDVERVNKSFSDIVEGRTDFYHED